MSNHCHVFVENLEEAELFKALNQDQLQSIEEFLTLLPDISYSEIWMNKNTPSYVAGFNNSDEIIISVPLVRNSD